MANRRFQPVGGRRMEFGRNDRNKNFGRVGVSPWQGGGPGVGLPNLLPLAGGSTEATTLALATNIINLLQPRQNPVPSLLDMPIRRDFSPNMGRFDRNFGPNRMGNQGNFRRTGNYNRAGERIYTNRKPFRPNDGPRQQNKSSPKKEADSKAKPVNESEQEVKSEHENEETSESKEGGEGKTEQVKTRYDHIDPQLLKCHICNKSMWDALSFENHVRGRAHAIMMQKTAESYALTADTMRQEFKIREIKRARRSGEKPTRDFYCAMCDMYASDGAAHRTNPGHRKLKKYLHPPCTVCHLEMPNRIELEQHRLTPEHLKTIQDKQGQVPKPRPEVMVISTMNMEQLYVREDRHRWRYGEQWEDRRYEATDRANQPDAEIKQENEGEGETQTETEVKKEQSPELDSENTILDYKEGDDLSNVTKEMFPAYSTERGVGESFLAELACVQCKLCNKVLDDAATAQVHLRTWRHHQLFTRLLAERCPAPEEEEEETGTQEATKRAASVEEDGSCKRRKISNGDAEDEAEQNGHEEDIKKEPCNDTVAEESAGIDEMLEENDGDMAMPPADQLDDWEQSVDEILEDEMNRSNNVKSPEPEPEPEPTSEIKQEKPESPEKVPEPKTPARATPRGRPRGRGRARGRY